LYQGLDEKKLDLMILKIKEFVDGRDTIK